MKKLIIGLLPMVLFLAGCGKNFSNGERAGIVTKFSEKGLIFKSWEGELLMALPISVAGQTVPEKFEFSASEDMAGDIKKALSSGKRVKLLYRQWFISPPTIDTDYVVVAVEAVN